MAQSGRRRPARPASSREGARERLLAAAREAALHAYAPYSGFRVGAAVVVETPDGQELVTGANVENASYGLTICAERAALAAACQRGGQPAGEPGAFRPPRISAVAVACVDAPARTSANERTPCGACRQWLAELAPEAVYYIDGVDRDLRLEDILPMAFRLERTE